MNLSVGLEVHYTVRCQETESQFIDLPKPLDSGDLIPASITQIEKAGAGSDIGLCGLFVVGLHKGGLTRSSREEFRLLVSVCYPATQ